MKPIHFLCVIFSLALIVSADAQTPRTSKPSRSDLLLDSYFSNELVFVSSNCLAGINSREEWESKRGEYRRQLQEMLGLWPMPPRGDLEPVITGTITNDNFIDVKLYFQALPKLYVTANLFLPRNVSGPVPAVLYECGHWSFKTNGISYGNKAVYQRDGEWFARNGYVCLVMDTVLAGEIPGIHTGTRDKGLWWWNSRGYTPAGVEAFFGIRGLDYLCSRPEVDTNHIGITGHSGGGAYSWTVTALDDRIKVAAPLAGMADDQSHLLDGVIDSHCDCNFPINIYRWDFPQVAALAAPRPLLIGGTDRDQLFHLDSTMRIYQKVRHIYALYNATNQLGLVLAPGIHDEVPELQLGVLRWFNRYLKGEEHSVEMAVKQLLPAVETKVFDTLPADNINSNIADYFVPIGEPQKLSPDELRAKLQEKVFNGWPKDNPPLEMRKAFSSVQDGIRFSAWDFNSEHDTPLRLYLLENAQARSATQLFLKVLDADHYWDWFSSVAAGFASELHEEQGQSQVAINPETYGKLKDELKDNRKVLAFVAPRGIGMTAYSGDDKRLTKIRRRYMLLGQTLDGMRVWDIRRAIEAVHTLPEMASAKIELQASGPMAVNALYAALFEPTVKKLDLQNLPPSQRYDAPDYLGVLKVTDIPQVKAAVQKQLN